MTRQTRAAETVILAELLDEIRRTNLNTTEEFAKLRGGITNAVLAVELGTFDSAGVFTRTWNVRYGSVFVANHSAATTVIVTDGQPGISAPGQGTGVAQVAPGRWRLIDFASTDLTIYGTAGEKVEIQVFTRPWPPAGGDAAANAVALGGPNPTADDLAAAGLLAVGNMLFDGTNWDRARALSGAGDGLGVLAAMQPSSTAPAASTPAANTAAVLTFAAVPGQVHRLTFLAYSYSAPNTAVGRLTVNDATIGNLIDVDIPIAAATAPLLAPVLVPLPDGGIKGTTNQAMVVTLAAGGVGIVGKLSAAKVTA